MFVREDLRIAQVPRPLVDDEELGDDEALVRVISAREATAHERQQYESG